MSDNIILVVISMVGTALACWIVILTGALHGRFTHDADLAAVQKYHEVPVPRIGGLALLLGLIFGSVYHGLQADQEINLAMLAGVAVIPVFLGGVLEDLRQGMKARERLLLAFFSATIAYYELKVGLTRTDWMWFDVTILPAPGIKLLLTIVMVGGLAHATNIIDGFNGLLLGVAMLTLAAFFWIAYQVDDTILLAYISIVLGSLMGVFVFNFPYGRIFLGDGGAYVIGFFLAILGLYLVKNHSDVSPWFPLVVLIYPIMETLFSIFRKKLFSGIPAMTPDQYHLHMLIHDRIVCRWSIDSVINRNAMTGVVMWGICLVGIVPAVLWWDRTPHLLATLLLFGLLYVLTYIWLIRRAPLVNF